MALLGGRQIPLDAQFQKEVQAISGSKVMKALRDATRKPVVGVDPDYGEMRNQIPQAGGRFIDERDAAEARMLDSKLRWLERLEELEKLTPEQRVKALTQEIAELETRKSFYTKALAESMDARFQRIPVRFDEEAFSAGSRRRAEELHELIDDVAAQFEHPAAANAADAESMARNFLRDMVESSSTEKSSVTPAMNSWAFASVIDAELWSSPRLRQ